MTKARLINKPKGLIPTSLALLLIASAFGTPLGAAGQLYRYTDENGNTVLNSTIPAQFVGKGYDILNARGRLIERVPPALTEEQIAARDAELERQKKEEEARLAQQQIDEKLLQLYSHPNDALRVLKRRIQDIEGVMTLKENKIASSEREIIKQESKAANLQRNGRAIPDNLIAAISSAKKDIDNATTDIRELEKEKTKVLAEFDDIIRRLEYLTKYEASGYDTWLQSINEPEAANQDKQSPPATDA